MHKEINEIIAMAKRNIGFEQKLVDSVINQDSNEAKYKSTEEAKQLHNLATQVGFSIQRLKGFTRLDINEKGILFARIDPEHYVEDILAKFFAERFPMYVVVLESRRGCFIKKKNQKLAIVKDRMEIVIKKIEKELANDDILCDLLDFDEKRIWNVFYNSANIFARNNKKYFMRNIPKKFHDLPGLQEEKRAFEGNQSLLAYE